MRVIIVGGHWLGCEVLALCNLLNVDVAAVVVPDLEDKLAARARSVGIAVYRHKDLAAVARLEAPDLLLAAHCHGFINAEARAASRLGCLAYHPSLLPRHRGRDAIEWAIRFGDKVAGGSLYWMDDGADTGPLAYQDWVWVQPDDTATSLWRRDLGPMGVTLFKRALEALEEGLMLPSTPQLETVATWEPSLAKRPLRGLD
jgi:methionyl-tRNA formyltransferase